MGGGCLRSEGQGLGGEGLACPGEGKEKGAEGVRPVYLGEGPLGKVCWGEAGQGEV